MTAIAHQMQREGCVIDCINGKRILKCPTAPAIEQDLGNCVTTPTMPTNVSARPDYKAMQAANLVLIAANQRKMEEELAAAELRMNPPKRIPTKTNPAFVAAGVAGIEAARKKTAQMQAAARYGI